jgi:sugar-specific transcriptional regulator TrmB
MKKEFEQLKIHLQYFGFSTKEADVYIALLELGKGMVSKISLKAGINRTTGYDILNSLVAKGVVSISGKEPRQEYAAEQPESIITYLNTKAEETKLQIKKAEEVLPEFNLLHAKKNRPKIRFYEGTEGLKHVYEDTLSSSTEILAYATVEDVHDGIPNYFPEYYKRRARKNISIRAIFPETPLAIERKNFDQEEKRETLLVPYEQYKSTPEINIYDDKIMIASWKEKLGIIIESEEIATALKKIYELAWLQAKQFKNDY